MPNTDGRTSGYEIKELGLFKGALGYWKSNKTYYAKD